MALSPHSLNIFQQVGEELECIIYAPFQHLFIEVHIYVESHIVVFYLILLITSWKSSAAERIFSILFFQINTLESQLQSPLGFEGAQLYQETCKYQDDSVISCHSN